MSQETITLFSGYFERSLDAKKRVAVPSAWLSKEEGETFHVVPHPKEGYLMVMTTEEFDKWEPRIMASSASAADKRMAIRKFYSEAHTVQTDKQGRVLLTEKHCERAGLSGAVIFIGTRSRFEIWSPERHSSVDAVSTAAYESVSEEIGM